MTSNLAMTFLKNFRTNVVQVSVTLNIGPFWSVPTERRSECPRVAVGLGDWDIEAMAYYKAGGLDRRTLGQCQPENALSAQITNGPDLSTPRH